MEWDTIAHPEIPSEGMEASECAMRSVLLFGQTEFPEGYPAL